MHRDRVELIVVRPQRGARAVLDECELTIEDGVVGDLDERGYVTVIDASVAQDIADGDVALLGDNLHVDFDIGMDNLLAGDRFAVGDAVLEVAPKLHLGCAKFAARFGDDAHERVNSVDGKARRLRGLNATVVVPGRVRVGDEVRKVSSR